MSENGKNNRGKVAAASMGVGIALGVVFGLAVNNLALGIGIGIALGVVIGARNRGNGK